jgi:hypothetical protein
MLKAVFDWFKSPSPKAFAPAVQPEAAPYKVETLVVAPTMEPAAVSSPAKCGCGRSPTGLCVGLHKLTPAQWAAEQARGSCQKINNSCDTPVEACTTPAKPSVAKRAPAKKQQFDKKPVAAITAAKKPASKAPAAKKSAAKKPSN